MHQVYKTIDRGAIFNRPLGRKRAVQVEPCRARFVQLVVARFGILHLCYPIPSVSWSARYGRCCHGHFFFLHICFPSKMSCKGAEFRRRACIWWRVVVVRRFMYLYVHATFLTEVFFTCIYYIRFSSPPPPPRRLSRSGEQSSSITPACFVPMWAGLPWPRVDCALDEKSGVTGGGGGGGSGGVQSVRLARCVESLRGNGLVQTGGVCTSLEVWRIRTRTRLCRTSSFICLGGESPTLIF